MVMVWLVMEVFVRGVGDGELVRDIIMGCQQLVFC